MKRLGWLALGCLLALPAPTLAHRLDEYLQATLLSVEANRVEGSLRLVPGVAVFGSVIASIDTNGDGLLSSDEQNGYARRVLGDLSLRADEAPLSLQLVSATFPNVEEMKQGIGQIQIAFAADLPPGAHRELTYSNHHESAISAYLVNCLAPRDPAIRIAAQLRNENQSFYRIQFTDAAPAAGLSGIEGAFRLGMNHIAEGTDHLLFLLTLLLVAPLVASGDGWGETATIGRSLAAIFRIVTSFTLGHSITLALAALGWVHASGRVVEVLVAASILLSAAHALRPLFPRREASLAAGFGLVHGLAFAGALSDLGLSGTYRLVSLLGFNLGIEAMQIVVIAAVMPSLLLLSRTRLYPVFRIAGALFAGLASINWIGERLLNGPGILDGWITRAASQAGPIAAALFLFALFFTAVTRLVELVEETPGAVAGQRANQVRLTFFN